jgi:hypothetical protein
MTTTRQVIRALCFPLALAACTADDGAPSTGRVALAVVATGSDGATYRLTAGTELLMTQTGVPVAFTVRLDGDAAVVTVPVPPGLYQTDLCDLLARRAVVPDLQALGILTPRLR